MLTVYTLEQKDQWDSIVRSFKSYDIYWLSGYVNAFKLNGDGEPLLFYYSDSIVRGINVVMKRDVADDEHFSNLISRGLFYDFSTPYGYGGWLIEGECSEGLFLEYNSWVETHGIICEFVRFHPILNNQLLCSSFYEVIQLGEVVHINLKSSDEIWNNLSSKNRNMIRKAIKNDVKVYNGRFPEIYEKFRNVYNQTMNNKDADSYYFFQSDFYTSLLYDLPHNAQVFWAEKNRNIIAACIILSCNGYMNYHLSGSLKDYSSLAPSNLLLYEVALWGHEHGMRSFYLGGGVGSEEDGLFRFKKAFFKGKLNHFNIGKKVFNPKKYEELINIRTQIDNLSFFPVYRG